MSRPMANCNWMLVEARELVTGQHSGLRSLPEMPADNPNLGPALSTAGVTVMMTPSPATERSAIMRWRKSTTS